MGRAKREIDFDAIYESKKCGKYKIIEEFPSVRNNGVIQRIVKIRFIDTNSENVVQLNQALSGNVRDLFARNVSGIGYLGDINGIAYNKKEYDMWYCMINRCYNPKFNSYDLYGALGFSVCNEWLCFSNFVYDLPMLEGYIEYANSMDKSKFYLNLKNGCIMYSKDSCYISRNNVSNNNIKISKKNDSSSSKFYGVYKTQSGSYQSNITINGIRYFLGTYSNEIAAATVYNYIAERCCINPILNERSIMMPINIAFSYITSRVPIVLPPNIQSDILNIPTGSVKEMCRIVRR